MATIKISVEMAPGLLDPMKSLEDIVSKSARKPFVVTYTFDQPASASLRRFFAVPVAADDVAQVLDALRADPAVREALPEPEAE